MIYNTYLLFFFIIFIALILCFYIYFNKNLDNNINFILKDNILKENTLNNSIENFENFQLNDSSVNVPNNLISNGNFQNGKNSTNNINQSGYNKIIKKKNPGNSAFVLEQKKTDELTYYELLTESLPNSKYNLYFWICIDNGNNPPKDISLLDFENLVKIKIQKEDFTNYIPRLTFNIIQKLNMNNDNNTTWYLVKYMFNSTDQIQNYKMNIYLNYSQNLYTEYMYFADIRFYRTLVDAENFIFNNNLLCYTDGYKYENNNITWHDLSGNGNDLFWSAIPVKNDTIGSLAMQNLKINGFSANLLSNDKFTILFCLNKNYENSASDDAEDANDEILESYLLSVPGNERYSFEIQINGKSLYLIVGNNKYKSSEKLLIYNKSLLSIMYDNGLMNIYLDGLNILSQKINKLYLNNSNIVINRNKNLVLNLYSLLFYNRLIEKKELDDIRNYFITNQNKPSNDLNSTPDINVFHMNAISNLTDNSVDNSLFKPYNKKMNDKIDNFSNENKFNDIFDNQDCKMKHDVITSEESNNYDECPKVYKKEGNYIVYNKPNTYYSDLLKYSGEKSYGNNLEKARYTYKANFPKCTIPSILTPGEGKNNLAQCPYIINELNPCYTSACEGVDWSIKNYKDLGLSTNCKKSISNYCQINNEIDDSCICWHPSKKDDAYCREYRRYFENPNDYCEPGQFKIEEHPDFNKYIRKDNIPCWGCKL
jgi:hypothetical protein